jgi:hypothetical protein
MRKKFLPLIFIVCAVLNIIVIGLLVHPSDNKGTTSFDNTSQNVIVTTIPSAHTSFGNPQFSSVTTDSSNSSVQKNTDKLTITSVQANLSAGTLLVSASNYYSSQITITNLFIYDYPVKLENGITIPANSDISLLLTFTGGITFRNTYEIRLLTLEGFSADYYKLVC